MKPVDATSLDRLHEVLMPPAVPWWPPAPAWWWLGALLLLALFTFALRSFLRWQRHRYRREAMAEWQRQHARLLQDENRRGEVLHQLAVLLKRTALTVFPRQQIAALSGGEWYAFLEQHSPVRGFVQGHGAVLEAATYGLKSASAISLDHASAASHLVRDWIRLHQVPPR